MRPIENRHESRILILEYTLQQRACRNLRQWETADPARLGGWWSITVAALHRGDPSKRVKISSVRKSFVSALYGIYGREGRISLDKGLAELGIDDEPALTEVEKRVTVRMLLQSRSGIYHGYVAGTPGMRAVTPTRGSHPPAWEDWRGHRRVDQQGLEGFQPTQAARPIRSDQFPSHLVVGDLGDDDLDLNVSAASQSLDASLSGELFGFVTKPSGPPAESPRS